MSKWENHSRFQKDQIIIPNGLLSLRCLYGIFQRWFKLISRLVAQSEKLFQFANLQINFPDSIQREFFFWVLIKTRKFVGLFGNTCLYVELGDYVRGEKTCCLLYKSHYPVDPGPPMAQHVRNRFARDVGRYKIQIAVHFIFSLGLFYHANPYLIGRDRHSPPCLNIHNAPFWISDNIPSWTTMIFWSKAF